MPIHDKRYRSQDLFNDISNETIWESDCPPGISHDLAGSMERIRMRMIEDLEK